MEAIVRVRLKLDDSVVRETQQCEGLKRWWVSVDAASHRTVSDLVSHILRSFQLSDSCPDGLLLTMDGFVLPPFESIAIFNDNDLLCVKRKGEALLDGGKEQATNKDFHIQTQTQLQEEDKVGIGNSSFNEKKRKFENGYHQNKSPDCNLDEVCNAVCCSIGNGEGTVTPSKPDGNHGPSRSSRRKKAQRLYKRTANQEQLLKKQSPGEELDDEDQDTGDEIVPVVVRPGHIRFVAPGKEKSVQPNQEAEVSFNWHGIMNNKKAKKWGKQKQTPSKTNESKSQAASKWNECGATKYNQSDNKWNEHKFSKERQSVSAWGGNRSTERQSSASKWNDYRTPNRNWASQKATPAKTSLEYEKLVPMTDFPVKGDTIAYRLLGMSSTFCPQLTSYRVGEVTWSDQESDMVQLVPVPEYPFDIKEATKGTSDESDASRYKEDGSLKIDFTSLADVRIVKRGGMNPSTTNGTPVTGWHSTSSASGWHSTSSASGWHSTSTASGWHSTSTASGWGNDNTVGSKIPSSQAKSTGNKWTGRSTAASGWGSTSESGWRTETPGGSKDHQSKEQPMSNNWTGMNTAAAASTSNSGNANEDVWEQISAAYIAKKEERLKEDNWNKKRKPVSNSWSYKTFRGGARPSHAMSRAQNGRWAN